MERKHRHLDGEAQEHRAEDEKGEGAGEGAACPQFGQAGNVEGAFTKLAGLEVEGQESQKHEGRSKKREQEELDRGVEPGLQLLGEAGNLSRRLVPPDTDHEIHGEKDDLKEDEEQHQVQSHKGPVHAGCQDHHQDQEGLGVLGLFPVVP